MSREWMVDALCAQIGDVELFHPDKGGSPREALTVCADCPVTVECLAYALDFEQRVGNVCQGVYGGTTAAQRSAMLGRRDSKPCEDCETPIDKRFRVCSACRIRRRAATQAAAYALRLGRTRARLKLDRSSESVVEICPDCGARSVGTSAPAATAALRCECTA